MIKLVPILFRRNTLIKEEAIRRMIDLSSAALKDLLKASNYNVYISCMGEEGFPNVSVRKVDIQDDKRLVYNDKKNSRTVQLLMDSPKVIINLLNEKDPFHGYKIKGEALFEEQGDNELVRLSIILNEGFPY